MEPCIRDREERTHRSITTCVTKTVQGNWEKAEKTPASDRLPKSSETSEVSPAPASPPSPVELRREVFEAEHSCAIHARFPAGTLVLTPDGPRPIESILSGDRVWGYDLRSGEWRSCMVSYQSQLASDDLIVTVRARLPKECGRHPTQNPLGFGPLFHPAGVAAHSRWSSAANTTGSRSRRLPYPEGIPADTRESTTRRAAIPSG